MILIGYRHGLRASELCDLRWSQVELPTGRLHVRRAKNGSPSVHPMQGDEIRALRRLEREHGPSSHVFMTERGGPMTPKAFHALFGRIGMRAEMPFAVHPHMLRHGCGYALANAGPTPAPYRLGSATRTSSTRFVIPSSRRTGSRTSGANRTEEWRRAALHTSPSIPGCLKPWARARRASLALWPQRSHQDERHTGAHAHREPAQASQFESYSISRYLSTFIDASFAPVWPTVQQSPSPPMP
jgi:hypothetical protein